MSSEGFDNVVSLGVSIIFVILLYADWHIAAGFAFFIFFLIASFISRQVSKRPSLEPLSDEQK